MIDPERARKFVENVRIGAATQRRIQEALERLRKMNSPLPHDYECLCYGHQVMQFDQVYQCITCGKRFFLIEDE